MIKQNIFSMFLMCFIIKALAKDKKKAHSYRLFLLTLKSSSILWFFGKITFCLLSVCMFLVCKEWMLYFQIVLWSSVLYEPFDRLELHCTLCVSHIIMSAFIITMVIFCDNWWRQNCGLVIGRYTLSCETCSGRVSL